MEEVELNERHWSRAYTAILVGNPAAGHAALAYAVCVRIVGPEGVEYVAPETHLLETDKSPEIGVQPEEGAVGGGFPVEVAMPVQSELVKYETEAAAEVEKVAATFPQLTW